MPRTHQPVKPSDITDVASEAVWSQKSMLPASLFHPIQDYTQDTPPNGAGAGYNILL